MNLLAKQIMMAKLSLVIGSSIANEAQMFPATPSAMYLCENSSPVFVFISGFPRLDVKQK